MAKNLPANETYEKIAEWLDAYRSEVSVKKKAKLKTLIVSNMVPVVKNIAKTIARRSYDPIEDLIQAGFIGLLKAIDKYSKEKNNNFRIYAGYLIIGEMKHYIRDKMDAIRVPRHIQELTIRINNFTKNLTAEEVQSITSEEVASALEVSQKAVDMAMVADRRRSTISLEDISSNKDSLNFEELLPADDYKERAEYEDSRIIFEEVINKLPPDERVIVDMYYKQDMNMKEIAEALVITPMSVSRKMKSALNIISKFVAEKEGSLVISDNNDK